MKRGHVKRLALLLAALMLVSLLPAHALAAEEAEPVGGDTDVTIEKPTDIEVIPEPIIESEPILRPDPIFEPEPEPYPLPEPEPEPYPFPDPGPLPPLPTPPLPTPDPDFPERFKDCPTLKPGESVHIRYDGTDVSGAMLFTAPESRDYMFYSEGDSDTWAEIYTMDGFRFRLSSYDDEGDNFSLTALMEEGETYVILTGCYTDEKSAEYDVFCRECPKVTGLKAEPVEDAAPLIIGYDRGYWDCDWDDGEEGLSYYRFSEDSFARVVSLAAVCDDGSEKALSFYDVKWEADQKTWTPGGENLLKLSYRDLTAEVSIPIQTFEDAFANAAELAVGGTVHVTYDGTPASGALRFTAPESWGFTFLSESGLPLVVDVRSADGEHIDSRRGAPFSLTLELEEGEVCYLLTRPDDGTAGEYDFSCRSVPKLVDLEVSALDAPLVIGVDDGRWIDDCEDDEDWDDDFDDEEDWSDDEEDWSDDEDDWPDDEEDPDDDEDWPDDEEEWSDDEEDPDDEDWPDDEEDPDDEDWPDDEEDLTEVDEDDEDDEDGPKECVRYYRFTRKSLDRVVRITGIYDDGSTAPLTLSDVEWEADQSAWTVGGRNELLITAAGVTRSVFINVADFSGFYEGCPALELDVPAAVDFDGSLASGVFTFTPAESGDYCFYSLNNRSDPAARLMDANGGELARNDDSKDLDNINFLIMEGLTAGETYVLSTGTSNDLPGTYSVVVSQSMPESGGYDSLSGVDLSGKAINLVFVVDTTGSMSDEIASVRSNLRDFVSAISDTGAILRIALIDYRDITIGEPTVLHYSVSSNMIWYENNDVEELREEIGGLDANGGGDRAESVVDSLGFTVEEEYLMFNSTAAKFVFLLTDADYKEENTHGLSGMSELIGRLQDADIAVSVITDAPDYGVYKDLASRTGGVLMDIYGDFSRLMGAYAANIVADAADFVPDDTVTPVESVSLGDDLTVPLGKLKNFTAYITPKNASDKRLKWEVEDESIVAISKLTAGQRLVVEGVSLGTTRITVRSYDGGYVDSFEMTVKEIVDSGGTIEATDTGAIRNYLEKMAEAAADAPAAEPAPMDYDLIAYVSPSGAVSGADRKDILNRIAGTGLSMSYVFDDDIGDMLYKWTFRGADVTDPDAEVDMTIETGGELDVSEALKKALGDFEVVDFLHKGALPGAAQIELRVTLPDGTYQLYSFDPVKSLLEKVSEVSVKDGIASFLIDRIARYVIGAGDVEAGPSDTYDDINGDGKVDPADAAKLLAGGESEAAAHILQYAVGLPDAWPEEGGEAGETD